MGRVHQAYNVWVRLQGIVAEGLVLLNIDTSSPRYCRCVREFDDRANPTALS